MVDREYLLLYLPLYQHLMALLALHLVDGLQVAVEEQGVKMAPARHRERSDTMVRAE
jgi:hypothetical protein